MGRRWSRKRKQQESKSKRAPTKERKPWVEVVPGNAKMEAYYALQGLHNYRLLEGAKLVECISEEEKEKERMAWMTSLRSLLPASFRIGTDVDPVLRERLELELDSHFCDTEMEIVVEEEGSATKENGEDDDKKPAALQKTKTIAPAKHIPYIPHAYQLSVDRRTIRRNPKLQEFHEWLTTQTSCGNITRQETVSMIPPIVLSVEPHHQVLDMCAAPGSKTSQLLEIVSRCDAKGDLEPRGCVVANDSDAKRAYMLVHQLRRINSPVVLVTSCDAQFFPLLKEPEGMFDRVLCDVPCSGDGTTRKNPGIWRHWSALGSLAIHPLQLGIALNGARLTKVGGYICYSTCAMNPIENEAVVAELLRAADGALELVDKRPDMPGLVARPGWSSWRVLRENKSRKQIKDHCKKNNAKMQARRKEWEEKNKKDGSKVKEENGDDVEMDTANGDKDTKENGGDAEKASDEPRPEKSFDNSGGPPPSWDEETLMARVTKEGLVEYKSFEEVPVEWKRSVRKTCFPPTEEEAAKFHLEKCLRCLPHDMDTGGFFVALLKKVAPMNDKAKKEALDLAQEFRPEAVGEDGNGNGAEPVAKRAKTDDDAALDSEAKDSDENLEADGADTTDANDVEMEAETTDADNTEMASVSQESADNRTAKKAAKGKPLLRGRGKSRGEVDNEGFVPVDDAKWKPLEEFYGFSDTFPRDQYMARSKSDAKSLYFIGSPIKNLMDRGIQERVTIVNSGLKSFSRNTKDCKVVYRVAQEGIHYLAPHMTKRKVVADVDDFAKCIQSGNIRLEVFSDEFAGTVRKLEVGSFVVALKGYENDSFKKLFLVMWRCRKDAIDCLVAKVEMDGMKSKLRAIPGYTEDDAKEAAA